MKKSIMKSILILCGLVFALSAQAADGLSISNWSMLPGKTQTVTVNMTNSSTISGFQFDLALPTGISIASTNGVTINTSRTGSYSYIVNTRAQSDGSTRIIVMSTSSEKAVFSGTSGAVLNLKLTSESGTSGNKTITLKNQMLTTSTLSEVSPAQTTATVHIHSLTATAAKSATCETAGNIAYWYCSSCQKYYSDANATQEITQAQTVIAAKGHTFPTNPTWTWANDGKSATAKLTCTTDASHVLSANATITSAVKTAATCTVKGTTTYTAKATLNGQTYTATKDVQDIPAKGHTYSTTPTWTWSTDGKTASAAFKCTADDDTQTINATVTSAVKTAATCTVKGTTTYTATVTFQSKTYTATKDVQDIPAKGHTYGEPTWTWTDFTSAKAIFTCVNNDDTQEVAAVITDEVTKEATDTEAGVRTYTATVTFGDKTYTDEKTEAIAAKGHTYGEPTWAWTDFTSAKAIFTCVNNDDTQEVAAVITSAVKVAATCETNGWTTYTATVSFNGETFTDSKDAQDILATGHTYSTTPTWIWADDGQSATAVFTCTSCEHEVTFEATISSEETVPATTTEMGVTTYTASVTFDNTVYTDTKDVQDIPVLSTEATDIAELDYAVYINDAKAIAGKSTNAVMNLKNINNIATWQADIVLPEGFSIAKDAFDEPMITVSGSRTTTSRHSIATNTLESGAIRILYNSASNKTISGTDGEVATLTLNIADDVEPGDYPIIFKNIIMSEVDQTGHKVNQIVSKITVMSYTPGDVNNDDEINAQDLVAVVNFILEIPIEGNIREAADINGDDNIDAMDFVGEVSLILNANLNGSSAPALRSAAVAEENGCLDCAFDMNSFMLLPGKRSEVAIGLQQTDGVYTCSQFDLLLPEGVHLVEAVTPLHSHSVAFHTLENGVTRVLLSSVSNKAMPDTDAVLRLTFEADNNLQSGLYDLTIDRALLVTPEGDAMSPASFSVSFRVGDATDINVVETETESIRYNLAGQRVHAAEQGVMIINGKKQFIK